MLLRCPSPVQTQPDSRTVFDIVRVQYASLSSAISHSENGFFALLPFTCLHKSSSAIGKRYVSVILADVVGSDIPSSPIGLVNG